MNVLIIAPHPDDEILGVGGTIAKRVQYGDEVFVCIITKGCEPLFSNGSVEIVRQEAIRADALLGIKKTFFLDFPAAMLETVPRYKLNGAITDLINDIMPKEVYIPHRGDMQMDHQMVADATMVALRPKYACNVKRIYAYETLSETGWNTPNVQNEFIPNVYEDISETLGKKLEAMKLFQSQLTSFPGARSIGAMEALARFRGSTVNVLAAEAFSLVREIKTDV